MTQFTPKVTTTVDLGVYKTGSLDFYDGDLTVPVPVKTVPANKLNSYDCIWDQHQHISEVYVEVTSDELISSSEGSRSDVIGKIKEKRRYAESGINIVFLGYQDTGIMSPMEARECVRILDTVSDVITTPWQRLLLEPLIDITKEDPVADPFHKYKRTVENFLHEAATEETEKPKMGKISFLRSGDLNDLLQLYTDFKCEFLGVDFNNRNPSERNENSFNPTTADEVGELLGRLSDLQLFEGSVLVAYNMPRCQYRPSSPIRKPENFVPAGMGFDVIGGNHIGIGFDSDGEQQNYNVFDPDISGYRPISLDSVVEDWPMTVKSKISPETIADYQPTTGNELISAVNAGQIQFALDQFRDSVESGNGSNYLRGKEGIGDEIIQSLETVTDKFTPGGDTTLGEFS